MRRRLALLGWSALICAVACSGSVPGATVGSSSPGVSGGPPPTNAACASPTLTRPGSEPRLARAAIAFDKATGQVILFGDPDASTRPQTWAWTAQTGWDRLTPAHSPPGRTWGNMAYDDATGTIVLFGGQAATSVDGALNPLADTWSWNGADWIEERPPASPPATVNMALTYEPSLNMVLGVRDDDATARSETWRWDGATWAQMQPGQAPQYPKMGAGIAYAQGVGVTLLFGTVIPVAGGQAPPDGKAWTYGDNTWSGSQAQGDPVARTFPGLATDDDGGVVMFGGSGAGYSVFGDTWIWYAKWTKVNVGHAPPARARPLMAYDSTCKLVVLYGGEVQTVQSLTPEYDTWAWNDRDWTNLGG